MAGPPLGIRVVFLAGALFVGVAIVAIALTFLFVLGMASIPPATLAVGILITMALVAAIAIAIVLSAGLFLFTLLAIGLFLVVALVTTGPIAIIAVIFFAILLTMVLLIL